MIIINYLHKKTFVPRSNFKALFIDEEEKVKVKLFDNLSNPISPEVFVDVVKCYGNGSGFYINLFMELALDNAKSKMTADVSNVI